MKVFLSPPHQTGKELEYLKKVLETNYIAPVGEFIEIFENKVKEFVNVKSACAVVNRTSAIHLALRLLDIKEGDEVFASTFTFIGSVAPILYQKAIPFFIDSDFNSWNMSPELLYDELIQRKKKGKKFPKAIILTHIYGQPAEMDKIMEIANEFEIPLIEDSAESLGATFNSKHTGTFGIFGIYSFNGNKIITTGGGGMLVSDNAELIEKARYLATQAKENLPYYEHKTYGYNYRMSNVLAAIGVAQMEVIEERIKRKREIFQYYKRNLESEEIVFMPELKNAKGNRWLTAVYFKKVNPEKIRKALEKNKIEARRFWKPMHLQPVFKSAGKKINGVSEFLFSKGLCLPSGTQLKEEEIDLIIEIIKKNV